MAAQMPQLYTLVLKNAAIIVAINISAITSCDSGNKACSVIPDRVYHKVIFDMCLKFQSMCNSIPEIAMKVFTIIHDVLPSS